MFEASCISVSGRISSREEWDCFVERLLATGLIDDDSTVALDSGESDEDSPQQENSNAQSSTDAHSRRRRIREMRCSGPGRFATTSAIEWCNHVWARTRPFGSQVGDLTFEDFCKYLTDDFLGSSEQPSPVIETQRSLVTAQKQIATLERIVKEWAPDTIQTRQMLEMTVILQQELEKTRGPVESLVQRAHGALIAQATSPQRNGHRQDASSFAFQTIRRDDLERRCASCRIRGRVQAVDKDGRRRASPLVLSDKFGHTGANSLETSLATDRNGTMVEVVSLRSIGALDVDVRFALNCHAAHRELMLSSYFPAWMGYSKTSELYYEYLPKSISLASFLNRAGPLLESQPLFASIISQTLAAFCDLAEQSTFRIIKNLSPENIFLLDHGTKVILGRIAWGDKEVCKPQLTQRGFQAFDTFAWQRTRERDLLSAFASIVHGCLGIERTINTQSRGTLSSSTAQDDTIPVFHRLQCTSGIRVIAKTLFRLSLPSSAPGKVWRCVRMVDSGTNLHTTQEKFSSRSLRSQVVALHDPDALEFFASGPGLVRVFLQEFEWWQDPSDLGRSSDSGFAGASLMCKVSVVPAPITSHESQMDASSSLHAQKVSRELATVLSACVHSAQSEHGHITLRDLQARGNIFSVDSLDFEAIQDDFQIHLGASSR